MMFCPNSRRMEPGGAFEGSVGPRTSRIFETAPTPQSQLHYTAYSQSAGQDTAYETELFDVQLRDRALPQVEANPLT